MILKLGVSCAEYRHLYQSLEVVNGEILPIVGVENSIHILSANQPLLTQEKNDTKASRIINTLNSRSG